MSQNKKIELDAAKMALWKRSKDGTLTYDDGQIVNIIYPDGVMQHFRKSEERSVLRHVPKGKIKTGLSDAEIQQLFEKTRKTHEG